MNLPAQQNAMQLPAHLQGYQSRKLSQTAAANIGTAAPPYISIQGNRFTLVDAAGNEVPVPTYDPAIGVYLDCVIFDIGDHLSKVFYGAAYDPNAQSYGPPACWSDNGTGPSRQAAQPQSPLCSTCPNAVWGSAVSKVSGKGVKACHDQQKIAVYVPGFPTPFQMRIPPNSLKNFRAYAEQFNGQQFDMDVMTTRLSFELQGVGTLLFQPVGWIDAGAAAAIADVRSRNASDSLVGRLDVARDPNLPLGIAAPQQEQAPAQPAFQPAPAPQAVALGFPGGGPAAQAAPFAPAQPAPIVAGPAAHPNFVPQGPLAAMPTQPATPMQPGQASAPTASPSEAPKQRRRRSSAAVDAGAPAAPGPQQAPFPHAGGPPPAQPQAFQPAPAPQAPTAAAPQPSFGMAPGAAPNPELAGMLATVFSKPAGQRGSEP